MAGTERWVKPKLVAEVEFAEWTPDGSVRHASFVALRTDKPAKAILRETALRRRQNSMPASTKPQPPQVDPRSRSPTANA